MPAEGELTERGRFSVKWMLLGAAFAIAAITRSLDDSAVFAGVLVGMIAGFVIASTFVLRWLVRWEGENGRRLLQHRKGMFRGADSYYCETKSSSGRFDRSREVAPQRA